MDAMPNEGPFRDSENPHERENRRLRRRNDRLNANNDFLLDALKDEVIRSSAVDEELAEAEEAREKIVDELASEQRVNKMLFVATIVSALAAAYVYHVYADSHAALRAENRRLRESVAAYDREAGAAHLANFGLGYVAEMQMSEIGRLEADLDRERRRADRYRELYLDEMTRADSLEADYDYEYWSRRYREQEARPDNGSDPIVMDAHADFCRASDLRSSPGGVCRHAPDGGPISY